MPVKADSRHKVWFVDDLSANRTRFEKNHGKEFDVRTFKDPDEVFAEVMAGNVPDALLIDVFFYTPDKTAEEVEEAVAKIARDLRGQWFADEKYARGIDLMKRINAKVTDRQLRPFPMFAYTTKGPFLLERQAWHSISESGGKFLLKNVLEPGDERIIIRAAIDDHRQTAWRRSKEGARSAMEAGNLARAAVWGVATAVTGVLVWALAKKVGLI